MRLLLLSVLGGGAALGLAEWLRRRQDRLHGPYLVQQLRAWHQAEPQITPAQMPAIQPLKVTHKRLKKQAEPLRGSFNKRKV